MAKSTERPRPNKYADVPLSNRQLVSPDCPCPNCGNRPSIKFRPVNER